MKTKGLLISLLFLLPLLVNGLPAPQDDSAKVSTTTTKPKTTTTTTTESSIDSDEEVTRRTKNKKKKKPADDSYEDEEEDDKKDEDFDLNEAVGDIMGGLSGLVGQSLKTVGEVVQNMSLHKHLEKAAETGMNVTQTLLKIGGEALENPEGLIKEKQRFVKGLSKTLEDTQPLIKAGLDEFGRHADLGSRFFKAYSTTMLGQLEGFVKVFEARLRCNTHCKRKKEGSEEMRLCEETYCKEIKVLDNESEDILDEETPETGEKKKNSETKRNAFKDEDENEPRDKTGKVEEDLPILD